MVHLLHTAYIHIYNSSLACYSTLESIGHGIILPCFTSLAKLRTSCVIIMMLHFAIKHACSQCAVKKLYYIACLHSNHF
jgi:hypothetical protein